ncbi:MAG: protoheme IX farnesyltransferase [Planctomycetaceae bacterium]|nr:protoheme IX farnesyltransferase [Planctomycetaceae bacterium]
MGLGAPPGGPEPVTAAADGVLPTPTWAGDLLELTKPRIASFVLLAALTAGWLNPEAVGLAPLWIALGVGAVAAGSSAINHFVERRTDQLMERTRRRPLATGRLSPAVGLGLGGGLGVAGTAGLYYAAGPWSALLAAGTFVLYAAIYTPLKRHTSLNTIVGAVPGAMPPLLAYGAVSERAAGVFDGGVWGWTLFLALFAWQFPHFLAIAYLYREDYQRGGHAMLPSLPGALPMAGRQALLNALAAIPATLLPMPLGQAGAFYTAAALVLGAVYANAAGRFAVSQDEPRARHLLRVSLVHLPLLFAAALIDRLLLAP